MTALHPDRISFSFPFFCLFLFRYSEVVSSNFDKSRGEVPDPCPPSVRLPVVPSPFLTRRVASLLPGPGFPAVFFSTDHARLFSFSGTGLFRVVQGWHDQPVLQRARPAGGPSPYAPTHTPPTPTPCHDRARRHPAPIHLCERGTSCTPHPHTMLRRARPAGITKAST